MFWDYGNSFLLEVRPPSSLPFVVLQSQRRYPRQARWEALRCRQLQISLLRPGYHGWHLQSWFRSLPMVRAPSSPPSPRVCTSGKPEDLVKSDEIAAQIFEELLAENPPDVIKAQLVDNLHWIKHADENKMVSLLSCWSSVGRRFPGSYPLRWWWGSYEDRSCLQQRHCQGHHLCSYRPR